jgi:hypothetical protein
MSKTRLWLSAVSCLTVFSGATFLSTPAAAAPRFACSERQIEYVKGVIGDECGDEGGTAWVRCDGHNVEFASLECGVY